MTINQFIDQVEGYYGVYPEKMHRVKVMTEAYLKDFKEEKFPELLKLVCMHHAFNYGPPDISAIEKAYEHAQKNGKCGDLKKIKATNYILDDVPTAEELQNQKKLMESGEFKGMMDQFNEKIRAKRA